ncbi:MAG: asparagine synthase C-terminal domain-containing protein, partial [Gemmatimonadota bacterium]|nr:asparagine synthase C-terminal domain-containing protein [Gemmatimonadota bacterium]
LLDHRVVELAWRIPRAMKIRDGRGKRILRRVLYRYVPRELIERPKTGFGLPIGEWLRGPLRSWADSLLGEDRLRGDGFFDATRVRDVWREHLAEKGRHQDRLWNILMFQAWLDAANRPNASELAYA